MKKSKAFLVALSALGVLVIGLSVWGIYETTVPKAELQKELAQENNKKLKEEKNKSSVNKVETSSESSEEGVSSSSEPKVNDGRVIDIDVTNDYEQKNPSIPRILGSDGEYTWDDVEPEKEQQPSYSSVFSLIDEQASEDSDAYRLTMGEFRWLLKNYYILNGSTVSNFDVQENQAIITYEANKGYSFDDAKSELENFARTKGIHLFRNSYLKTEYKNIPFSSYKVIFRLHYKG